MALLEQVKPAAKKLIQEKVEEEVDLDAAKGRKADRGLSEPRVMTSD